MKVCHITTVHSPFDIRIFHKECKALKENGHDVVLVAHHDRSETVDGIELRALPPAGRGKLNRMAFAAFGAFRTALKEDAAVYHIHDPELVPYGVLLTWFGKKVIYDAHEDWPRGILSKANIPFRLRRPIAWLFEKLENFAVKRFDAAITATAFISNRFAGIGCRAETINNYPVQGELWLPESGAAEKKGSVCYLGLISEVRGAKEMLEAVDRAGIKLVMAGPFFSRGFEERLKSRPDWGRVRYMGQLNRQEVARVLSESLACLVLFHPAPNHLNAQPNKIFEYMSAGIPVIGSHFPLWREIIEGNQCGLCVDPMDPAAIADAIRWIADHPEEARQMGERGRRAVEEKYNWENESHKLTGLYERLLGKN